MTTIMPIKYCRYTMNDSLLFLVNKPGILRGNKNNRVKLSRAFESL